MKFRNSVFIALGVALTAQVAAAAEVVWPRNSAGELSIFVTMLRFQLYADHCSGQVPQSKPEFESLLKRIDSYIQGTAKGLLASDEFKGMKDKPVPDELIEALTDSFDDVKHSFERRDAASICPRALENFGAMDDESLKFGLTSNLKAIQNMIQKLEARSAR